MARQLQRRCRQTWASLTNAEIQVVQYVNMHKFLLKNLPPTASADECAAAAEIYDCGKKKAPELTSAIQENVRNKAAAAPVGVRQTLLLINA
jgi:hypothetical protein